MPSVRPNDEAPLVLLIEDDTSLRRLLEHDLPREGFRVVMASDGHEGLAAMREHSPAIVILDVHMPKMDGWEVLARAKDDPAIAHIPVVVLSGDHQRTRGYSFGASDYLVKPLERASLLNAIRRHVIGGTGTILIVGDDASLRERLSLLLQRAGFGCVEARDAEDAILKTRITHPRLVITERAMHGGLSYLHSLRDEAFSAPVIALIQRPLSQEDEDELSICATHVIEIDDQVGENVVRRAKALLLDAPASHRQLKRVLYVEDSAENRELVRRHLHDEYVVLEAADGEHGLERARREVPDVVLMDLSLPRMDGWEATRRIRETPHLAHVPVIVLTSHASPRDRDKAQEVGCTDYLLKPIDREALLSAIRRCAG